MAAVRPCSTFFASILGLSPALGAATPEVAITEIHFHPGAGAAGTELIEITNLTERALDISGWRLEKAVELVFPEGFTIAPKESVVACANEQSFRATFGAKARLVGQYRGRLRGSGELVRLVGADGHAVTDVRYATQPPWPTDADGKGASLTRADPTRDADDPGAWIAAPPSPGAYSAEPKKAAPFSLFEIRQEPHSPEPERPCTISVRLHSSSTAKKVALQYRVKKVGATKSLPMRQGDKAWQCTIPAQPHGTLVRYWIEAEDVLGSRVRLPPVAATPRELAYYVERPDSSKLPRYTLVIEPEDLQALDSNPYSNELRPATFVAKGDAHLDAGVRFRGAWGRGWPKKSWKVVLPKGVRSSGRRRFNLNSCYRDESFLREVLAYEVFGLCGAPTLEAKLVELDVNGVFWGLHVDLEQPRGAFLERAGVKEGSVLFKASSRALLADERAFSSAEELAQHYSIEQGKPDDFEALLRFTQACAQDSPGQFFDRDVELDRYVNYACACVLTQNWDGFNKNHFLLWDKEGSNRWLVVPWDLDRTFGDHWSWAFDESAVTPFVGTEKYPGPTGWNRLLDRFFSDPILKKRFHDRLGVLLTEVFTEEKLTARIDELVQSAAREAELDRKRWGGTSPWPDAVERVRSFVTQRRQFLIAGLPGGEPSTPSGLRLADGASDGSTDVTIECAPFSHPEKTQRHKFTRWQAKRGKDGSWDTPVIDWTDDASLTRFVVRRGTLEPRTGYRFRVAHVASNGKTSAWSEELELRTGDFPFRTVSFDLKTLFNADLVANPGDPETDAVDDRGGSFIVDGFDGRSTKNPLAQGFPRDGHLGMHRLGDYSRSNAVSLGKGAAPIEIDLSRGRYTCLRFLVVGGGGDSTLPVRLEYSMGSASAAQIPCDDWYDDNPPEGAPLSVRNGAVPILNGLDRIRAGTFKDRNEPSVFEVAVFLDPKRELTAIVLESDRAVFQRPGSRYHLLAITGIAAE